MITHLDVIEKALKQAMDEANLEMVAGEHGERPLHASDGEVIEIEEIQTLELGGFMTRNRGVALRLSDGSEFTVEIKAYRAPHGGWRE
ncbi:hypothetical protein ACQEVC_34405 [Plantactinospora sp. CA-294935]|uniref:hypothetical protein n=1 Tax=Plantactinospora sp. CA-294935 TaxID=3240012 RepID=UPI003D8EBD83